jgi:hypothetical protein
MPSLVFRRLGDGVLLALWVSVSRAILMAEGLLRLVWRAASRRPRIALVLLAVLLAGSIVASREVMLRFGPRREIERALADGKKDVALREARTWAASRSSEPDPHVWLGLALVESGKPEDAVAELKRAFELDSRASLDPTLSRVLIRAMDREEFSSAKNLIVSIGAPLAPALEHATHSERFYERWNAAKGLELIGLPGRADKLELLALDLEHGTTCRMRKNALKQIVDLDDSRGAARLERARIAVLGTDCQGLIGDIDQAMTKLAGSADVSAK